MEEFPRRLARVYSIVEHRKFIAKRLSDFFQHSSKDLESLGPTVCSDEHVVVMEAGNVYCFVQLWLWQDLSSRCYSKSCKLISRINFQLLITDVSKLSDWVTGTFKTNLSSHFNCCWWKFWIISQRRRKSFEVQVKKQIFLLLVSVKQEKVLCHNKSWSIVSCWVLSRRTLTAASSLQTRCDEKSFGTSGNITLARI